MPVHGEWSDLGKRIPIDARMQQHYSLEKNQNNGSEIGWGGHLIDDELCVKAIAR